MNAPLRLAPSVCPHDCTSTCALEVELIDARTIGRVRGSQRHAYTGGVICEKVAEMDGNKGYNAATDTFEDLVKSGIIDPTKVTRTALQNAASVSTLLLTSDALIAEMPKDDKKKGGGGHDDHMD